MTYFDDAVYKVTEGNVVYAKDINNPLAAIAVSFNSLVSDIQTGNKIKYSVDTGAVNAYAVALDPAPVTYKEGLHVWLKPLNVNTGPSTLNINGLGAKEITRTGGLSLQAGDLAANYYVAVKYSGDSFQLVSGTGISESNAKDSADAAALSEAAAESSASEALISENNSDVSETNAAASAAAAAASVSVGERTDAMTINRYVATAGQSSFTITEPAPEDNILCFMNSRKLKLTDDYTLNSSTAATVLTLGVTAELGDELEIISFNTHNISLAANTSIADAGNIITATNVEGALQENRQATIDTTAALHPQSHAIVSHSDTSATGAELDALTDNSTADLLHRHNQLLDDNGNYVIYGDGSGNATCDKSLAVQETLTVVGAIIPISTVDGRDVFVDGTKLDGISTGADVSSGLEFITEGGKFGWRLVGAAPANYADIGNWAVDYSHSSDPSSVFGASGSYSLASGRNVIASGYMSRASGFDVVASAPYSDASGRGTVAINEDQSVLGKYNVGTNTGTIFEVGIGTGISAKANGLEVHKDGKIVMPAIPTADPVHAGALWNDSGTLKISAG